MRYKCQECGKGEMRSEIVKEYRTLFAGKPLVVPDAEILRCTVCKKINVTGKELKRWEAIQRGQGG